jgi:hypothetical protein
MQDGGGEGTQGSHTALGSVSHRQPWRARNDALTSVRQASCLVVRPACSCGCQATAVEVEV